MAKSQTVTAVEELPPVIRTAMIFFPETEAASILQERPEFRHESASPHTYFQPTLEELVRAGMVTVRGEARPDRRHLGRPHGMRQNERRGCMRSQENMVVGCSYLNREDSKRLSICKVLYDHGI